MTKALFAAAARAASLALVTVALVAGCSSTTSGSGSSGGFGTGGGGAGTGGAPGSSAPTGSSGGGGGGGGGASSTGNFCHDWTTISSDLTDVTSGNVADKLVAKFDSLAAEAPAAIKTDVQDVDAYVHDVVSGKVDSSKAQQLATAFEHIGQWMAQNC